jgi:hypothetical protein
VSIDGGTLLLILAALVLVLALSITVVVFGFVKAPRAGRGSPNARGWWIVILAVESLYALGGLGAALAGDFSLFPLLPAAIIAGQVALYLQARKDAGG